MWFTDGPETHPNTAGRPGRDRAPAPRARSAAAARCRRGAAHSVEYALIMSGLFTMMFGAVEMAWQGLTAVALENGLAQGSRTGSLGHLKADGTRSGQACPAEIIAAVRKGGGGLLNGSSLKLETTAFGGAKNAGLNQGGTAGTGLGGHTVVYTVTYDQPFLFAGKFVGRDKYVHKAIITVRNEPFADGGSNAQACS